MMNLTLRIDQALDYVLYGIGSPPEPIEPYPRASDNNITCQACGENRPRYAPGNVCCETCNAKILLRFEERRLL